MKLLKFLKKNTVLYGAIGTVVGLIGSVFVARKVAQSRNVELASTPKDLSWGSWKKALLKTKDAISNKNLSMLASGIAYGGTLAFFPLVIACVAIASIVIDKNQIQDVVNAISSFLPSDMASLLTAQLKNAVNNESANFVVAIIAIAIALFGVSGAMNSLVSALNVAYKTKETRNFIKVRLISIGLTVVLIIGLLIVLPLIGLGSDILRHFGVPEILVGIFSVVRWILLAAVMTIGLAVIYRYAPNRKNARWQWVSWGAVIATILWLIVTTVFFIYLQNFANFSQSYSLFAGIIVLMMWLNFTGLIVLLGAEVNSQLEERTLLPTIS
jgi:membrane protein